MIGIFILTGIGLVLGILITIVDDNTKDITNLLPGYNCNACGFSSCKGMAEAVLEDKDVLKKCKFLKEEQILEIRGLIDNN